MIERFEDLVAWQKARQLAGAIFRETSVRPFSRDFTFRDQICGAALSVPSNIAEGYDRDRDAEFLNFLRYAKASCGEVRSDLYVAYDVGYLDGDRLERLLPTTSEVSRVIKGLARKIAETRR